MKTVATILASVGLVAAHGYVDSATIGGKAYQFYQPERVSRSIPGNGPVEDATSIDVQCNAGSEPAKLHAPAAAGSDVTLNWTLWPDSHVGPVITYMARCPDSGCQDWSPGTEAVWFKVKEGGREGTSNTWATTPLMGRPRRLHLHHPRLPQEGLLPGEARDHRAALGLAVPRRPVLPRAATSSEVTGRRVPPRPRPWVRLPWRPYKGSDAGITYDAYKGESFRFFFRGGWYCRYGGG
ncbi:hypothetical protein CHGG_04098 [Chaetomium globosum CBS 148.51]|uniref:lytic cellulose monooxygenase (C4-dehydrogenating) n=1 Tax=Chaetomium globosum (strain ATCC 6205 / CBS 148.51 / DSM 1962 / NBRC 6347 / NRRL 1970) TaxID=306901 RepID=Q2H298_CHAGB|nr:uncharacterized protein CHGG_04098 [Chaetomium globosum CBS 148.51]EAQ87479.1 hypothetical protein CHGG_04098 [Chaetomium globosum CBS 148.51]